MPPSRRNRNRRPQEGRGHVQELLQKQGIDWKSTARALGSVIKARRKNLGLTQATLAERMGISVPWVGVLECGRGSPSLEMLALFAVGLQTTPAELLSEATASLGVRPRARAALTELQACLAALPPETAEAVCETVVGLVRSLTGPTPEKEEP